MIAYIISFVRMF